MRIGILKKIRSYLFLKIWLVFAVTFTIIVALIILAQRLFFLPKMFPAIQRNAVHHALYIIDDLGIPPDIQKAQQLAEKQKILIRFKSPSTEWTNHKDMIDFTALHLPPFKGENGVYAGFNDTGLCVDIHREQGRYLFVIQSRGEGFKHAAGYFVITILIFTALSMLSLYFVMNWQLKPIKVLREGVKQLSTGNIDYRMSTTRVDELGKLVDSVNTMTGKIREMLQARDRLLLDVSHELRSPLTRIKVALEFLDETNTKTAIRDDISEMETMITELLETDRLKSQHGGLKTENVTMLSLVREVCSEFQEQKPGVKIVSFPDTITLDVDPRRLKTLFRNILDNALRYSDPDGYPVEISLREKTNEIIIAVQDFGTGIPEQDLPFIFEPFYRVDKSRSKKTGGYGLGMSLSKRIMEAHDGSIEISSRLNTGTTVFLKFKR